MLYIFYMDIFNFHNEKIQKALEGMMSEIGFEGIYSIEFLIDQEDNYYFSEINFRNSTWSYAATRAGMNLITLWSEAMLTKRLPDNSKKNVADNFMAMVEPIDYGKRVKTGKIELGKWLKDFKEANCTFYYSKEDSEPFMFMCRNWERLS